MLYFFENSSLDTDRRELRRGRRLIQVEPQVFDLLEYVIRNRQRVVSKDDLIKAIWAGRTISDSALSTGINAARSAINDSGEEQRLLKTFPRKGFRFVGEVQEDVGVDHIRTASPALNPDIALPLPETPSIVVLAFTNMSGDAEQDYFADGMAEEITTALARFKWLFVVARNSSFTYKGRSVDVRQIGRELGVRYVLEGSVRRSANRLRLTGQLIDATSGLHIWADRFEAETGDVFDLQDRFTECVVAAIEPTVQIAEIERIKHKTVAEFGAYDLLLRAQQLEHEFTEKSLSMALTCLEQALAIDPNYAPALALAAYCYAERRNQGWSQDLEGEAAAGLRLVARASELGNDDSNVMWMVAYAVWRLAQDAPRARALAYRSLELNSNSAVALAITAWMEAHVGNPIKAIELCRRAERLNPRDPKGWMIATSLGIAHFFEGRFDLAVVCFEKALDHNPRFTIALRDLAASYAMLGEIEKAANVIQEVLKIEPQLTLSKLRARTRFIDERSWEAFANGLLLAGLPQ